MQTYSNLFSIIRHVIVLLIQTFFLFVILPVTLVHAGDFVWAKAIGDTSYDEGNGITIDSSGNVYTTGSFRGTVDFDPGPETFNLTSEGGSDIFISKLDSNGDFIWAKTMGGPYPYFPDVGRGITVDGSGNVYSTGSFYGTVDFDPGPETFYLTSADSGKIFISKLDSNGDFVWAKAMGSSSSWVNDIIVDGSGNVYTTGSFEDTADFDPGPGTFNLTSEGGSDIFISKLDSNGDFVWAKAMGEFSTVSGYAIFVDDSGNVYTTGSFAGTGDFDPGPAPFYLTGGGIFISKLDSNGDFVWAKAMNRTAVGAGGTGKDISLDASGNIYTTGSFKGTVDFDPGPETFNLTSVPPNIGSYTSDIFISKLDSNGDFVWAWAMGGKGDDYGKGISIDDSGNVYTTGSFGGTVDFDPGPETFYLTSADSGNIFISKLDSNVDFVWAWAMGSSISWVNDIIVDGSGNVYTTGSFKGTGDFDPGPGTFNLTSAGAYDIFILRLRWSSSNTVTPSAGPNGSISPATPQTINHGATISFIITPDDNYHIDLVTGCLGTLEGNTYTTGPVVDDCMVTASFVEYCFPWAMFLPAIISAQ